MVVMSSLRRISVKRNFIEESELAGDGFVSWDEEFDSFCSLASTDYKDSVYHPWEIRFTVVNGAEQWDLDMGKKRVMEPAESLDLPSHEYNPAIIQAPRLSGFLFKLFAKIIEAPILGSLMISSMKKQWKMDFLVNTEIPEEPMFKPEYPPRDPDPDTVLLGEDWKPEERVDCVTTRCLPGYNPANFLNEELNEFRYWKIRDYAYAYQSKLVTPSIVAERIIAVLEEFSQKRPPAPLLVSFDAKDIRNQAAASTKRFEDGNPLSFLDGIFIAVKDDINCHPYISKVGTTWLDEVNSNSSDSVCVSRLRSCGVILLGKTNLHELRMGASGNNPNYGTVRNPHAEDSYTGGSSSGAAAIVASGLCPAALGTDAGGSVRIPSSLCGVVGLKTTYGRTDMTGSFCDSSTVEVIGPIASTVEDAILVYAAILGSSPSDKIALHPPSPSLPNLKNMNGVVGSLRLGKYSKWFNDVVSTDISDTCQDIVNALSKTHGCEVVEIVVPELLEMHTAHLVTMGTEMLRSVSPYWEDSRKGERFTPDSRINIAIFKSYTASDYVSAQCLRRRMMHHHLEIFKQVDVIVTPTTGITAPKILASALKSGETNLPVTGYLMQFAVAANLLGFPAITVPVGYDKQGLPIGLQFIGKPWGEASILQLASAVEELCAKSRKRPASYFDVLKES